ncbi:sugar-binding transcriptional regulator [Lichenihabitans sp. Uapishka_5]|uniref:sugar-binding transcriptional regulator n=1 Tax=Lichenihabitans sp. Uapishka_5 TaxID=3037302 RepID=UPI0029E7E4FD|nr:sugar-binding transcriptional regulator [Lichenihabitans sp. Uapishka_5]MDX7950053.1 sugar-binding transcriptional regulator [Lichenihabitans sp. Uapishka_5]
MNDLTFDPKLRRLDLAARAAWLYYIKRRTQDEIAVELNVSRPNAQRLVALALSEGLVRIRIDHPLTKSIELGERVRERFELTFCDVAPSGARGNDAPSGVAHRAAELLENFLSPKTPQVLAFGTGRTLREAARLVSTMSRPDHKIVSVVGNLSRDGRASPYDVVMRLSDRVGAQCYPLPLPVIVDTEEECAILKAQRGYRTLQDLYEQADALMFGVGRLDEHAPLLIDGFITPEEFDATRRLGAIGELTSRSFDASGRVIDDAIARRLTAMELRRSPTRPTILVASGREKAAALRAALVGRLGNGVIIDEDLAEALLCDAQ